MSSVRATVAGLRGDGRGRSLLIVAAGWLFLNGFRVVLPAVVPEIKLDFGVNNATVGVALTLLWVLYAGLQFPAGITADRTGERRLLVVAAILASLSFAAFYLASVFWLFLVACALFGLGAGLYGTPRDMWLSRTFVGADNTAYAVTFAAGSLGAAGLPIIATAITARWSWHSGVVWMLPPVLLVGVGLWWFLPQHSTHADERGPTVGETVRRTGAALRNRRVVLASCVFVPVIFCYQALISFLPTYLVEIKGLETGTAATLFGLLFVFGALVQPVAGHLADQIGDRVTAVGLIVLATGSVLVLPIAEGLLALAVLVPFLGIRIAIAPITSAMLVRELPEPIRGTGWGLLRSLFFGLGAAGSTVLGLLADAGRFDLGMYVIAGLTGLTAFFWLLMPPRTSP